MSGRKRFRILSRDNFTCRYCGRRAPEVVLQVDHIVARTKGGSDDDTNLITACFECNQGKLTMEVSIELPAQIEREKREPAAPNTSARLPKPARKTAPAKPKQPRAYIAPGPEHCPLCKTVHVRYSSSAEVIGTDGDPRRSCLVNPCTGQFIAFQPKPNLNEAILFTYSYDPNETVEELKKKTLQDDPDVPVEFKALCRNMPVLYLTHETLPEGATILYCDTRGHRMEKRDDDTQAQAGNLPAVQEIHC